MLENIRLSLQGILSHKVRSILTMLGIIIGIAAIIAIVSTIKGTNEQIKNNLIGAGNNTVSVQLYQGDSPYDFTYQSAPDGVPVISQAVRDNIAALDNVESASFYRTRSYCNNVYYQNTQFSGAMYRHRCQHTLTQPAMRCSREEDSSAGNTPTTPRQ